VVITSALQSKPNRGYAAPLPPVLGDPRIEQCLLATRGKPSRKAKDVRRLVVEKRREHSRKPECVRERIERLVAGPYLELFARETKPGRDCWGEVALFDTARSLRGAAIAPRRCTTGAA
jgi:hypothetical protein